LRWTHVAVVSEWGGGEKLKLGPSSSEGRLKLYVDGELDAEVQVEVEGPIAGV